MKKLACLFLVLAASGCPDIKTDVDDTDVGPVVEFDPSSSIVPFPNNLLIDPTTGKVNIPASCSESASTKALREGVLNKLDGFGLYEAALTATFSEPIDAASLTGGDGESRVVLYKRASASGAVDPATAEPIPVLTQVGSTIRFGGDMCAPSVVAQLAVVPLVPLEQKSTYVVALRDGITTADGKPLNPSPTWRLVRTAKNPVTIVDGVIVADDTPLEPAVAEDRETLLGIDLLWRAHAQGLAFLASLPSDKAIARGDVLLAWEFTTQTTTDTLDPTVSGSPASKADASAVLAGNVSLPGTINRAQAPYSSCDPVDTDLECYLRIQLGRGNYDAGKAACTSAGCAAVGDVIASALPAKQYQIETDNPYTGAGSRKIPGPWSDPNDPAQVKVEQLTVLAFLPVSAMPANGYPALVFQHGLGRSQADVFAIGSQLAAQGFATFAIDAVAHGSRAVRISDSATAGCDGTPDPTQKPKCFAPFLSPNLGATRDNIRQTVLDQQQLVAALKHCGTANCGALGIDGTKIMYMGQSLGGIMGSIATAVTPDIKGAVLNVPGVGWVDVLENTQTLAISCSLVDGLIDAGILMGEKSDLDAMPQTGLCTTSDWKTQPGYIQFSAIGRWVLDPADPANFTRKLAARRLLIQEVVGDTVVPNVATGREGALVGLTPLTADTYFPPPAISLPSVAITMNPTSNKWVRYPTLPADTGFPGNSFNHGSLLSPAAGTAGALGTARMQTDALTFLVLNR